MDMWRRQRMSKTSSSASATPLRRWRSSSSIPAQAPNTAGRITSSPAAVWATRRRWYLLERGVRLTGIDGWSWDAPFVYTAKKYAETRDASLIWEGHKAGRHIGYCHIEKLHNLEQLPSTGFTVSCFPVKIERASAGWTRAVAIIDG